MNYKFKKISYKEAILIANNLLKEYSHVFAVTFCINKFVSIDEIGKKFDNREISYCSEINCFKLR